MKTVIISFEGLLSYIPGFVRNGLVKPVAKEFPEVETISYSWLGSASAARKIRELRKTHGTKLKILVIGHSFGAGIAVFKMLDAIGPVWVDVVLTLDPRSWTSDYEYSRANLDAIFMNRPNVGKWFNFFQTGPMRGHFVAAARNEQLFAATHTGLPKHPSVQFKLREILRGEG